MLELKKTTYQLISNEGKNATKCRDDAGNIMRYLMRFKKEKDERVAWMGWNRGEWVCEQEMLMLTQRSYHILYYRIVSSRMKLNQIIFCYAKAHDVMSN
jgi:hypothetical protein